MTVLSHYWINHKNYMLLDFIDFYVICRLQLAEMFGFNEAERYFNPQQALVLFNQVQSEKCYRMFDMHHCIFL